MAAAPAPAAHLLQLQLDVAGLRHAAVLPLDAHLAEGGANAMMGTL